MISMTKTRKKIKIFTNLNTEALTNNINRWIEENDIYPEDFKLSICQLGQSKEHVRVTNSNVAVCAVIYSEEVNGHGGE